jgi:hypothetical protein
MRPFVVSDTASSRPAAGYCCAGLPPTAQRPIATSVVSHNVTSRQSNLAHVLRDFESGSQPQAGGEFARLVRLLLL